MNHKQLDRLIAHRKRVEKERGSVLRGTVSERDAQRKQMDRLAEVRRRAEEQFSHRDARAAEDLRRDHDYIAKTTEVIAHIEASIAKTDERIDRQTTALVEARREVRLAEILLERRKQRLDAETQRREQTLNDDFAAQRQHDKKQ